MAASWAKMAADLDSHPKVRRAGRSGREVFLFVLRRNAALDLGGQVPKAHVEGWYLADQLMMDEPDAVSGLSQCVRTGLLADEGDHVTIVGWDDAWGKRPLTEAERKRSQRVKSKGSGDLSGHVTTVSGQDRDGPECHAREEKREEEKREEKKGSVSGKPDAAAPFADRAVELINAAAGTNYRPNSAAILKLCRALIKNGHTAAQLEVVVASKRAWIGDPKMGQFFRPATLLAASKFASYLDDAEAGGSKPANGKPQRIVSRFVDEPEIPPAWPSPSGDA